jgi:peptidoglycan/xylan/chitin deacetylase (PgdA/CDA1 family)
MNVNIDPISVFMYHDVRDFDSTLFPDRYKLKSFIHPSQLEFQLDIIQQDFNTISVEQLALSSVGDIQLPPNPAILTFDDGLLDHYTVVFPRLVERGLKGVFFLPVRAVLFNEVIQTHKIQFLLAAENEKIIVQEIFHLLDHFRKRISIPPNKALWAKYSKSRFGKKNWWSREMVFVTNLLRSGLDDGIRKEIINNLFAKFVTRDEKAFGGDLYMQSHQAKELLGAGMEIGGHGLNSVNLLEIPERDQKKEVAETLKFLECEFFGDELTPSFFFSYPNGGYNGTTLEILDELNCKAAFTVNHGTVLTSLLEIPRIDAPQHLPLE